MDYSKTYLSALNINVSTTENDLTFELTVEYLNKPNDYVKDTMNFLCHKLAVVVRACWYALEHLDHNIEQGFSHKICFAFMQCTDEDWEVNAKVENADVIGRTLIGISQRILTDDPIIDNVIASVK